MVLMSVCCPVDTVGSDDLEFQHAIDSQPELVGKHGMATVLNPSAGHADRRSVTTEDSNIVITGVSVSLTAVDSSANCLHYYCWI